MLRTLSVQLGRPGTTFNEGAETTLSGDVAEPDVVNDDEGPSASKLNSNEPLSGLVAADAAPEFETMIDETARAKPNGDAAELNSNATSPEVAIDDVGRCASEPNGDVLPPSSMATEAAPKPRTTRRQRWS